MSLILGKKLNLNNYGYGTFIEYLSQTKLHVIGYYCYRLFEIHQNSHLNTVLFYWKKKWEIGRLIFTAKFRKHFQSRHDSSQRWWFWCKPMGIGRDYGDSFSGKWTRVLVASVVGQLLKWKVKKRVACKMRQNHNHWKTRFLPCQARISLIRNE